MNNYFGKVFVHNILVIAFIIFGAQRCLAETKLPLGKSFYARHYAGIPLRDLDKAWNLISDFNGLPKLHPVYQLTTFFLCNYFLLTYSMIFFVLLTSVQGHFVKWDWRIERHPWAWMHSLSQVCWRRLGSRGTGGLQCGRFYFLVRHHGRQRALLQLPIHCFN